MELIEMDKSLFYKVTIYLDVEDLKKLEKTNKRFKKRIKNNPKIENRLLRYNYNIAKNQLKSLRENPLISCIDFLEQKKIENGNVVDRFEDKRQLYEYVKNKFYFQNYRFESLYDNQFRIFQKKLKKNKIKNKTSDKPLLLFQQKNNKKEKINKIEKKRNYSYKSIKELIQNEKIKILLQKELSDKNSLVLYQFENLMRVKKKMHPPLKKIKTPIKKIREKGKKYCPIFIFNKFFKKD